MKEETNCEETKMCEVPTELLKKLIDQKLKFKMPRYEFKKLEELYYCTVKYDDQSWTSRAFGTKREARNAAAQIALDELEKEYKDDIKQLASETLKRVPMKSTFGGSIRNMPKELHCSEIIPAVKKLFDEEKLKMQPSILLNELALSYQLGQPNYVCLTLPKREQSYFKYEYIAVDVSNRRFNPFIISKDFDIAKNHVADIAFKILYEEIVNSEMKIIIQKDLDHKKSIGAIMLKEDIKTIPPLKSYKNVVNDIGLPIEVSNNLMNTTSGPEQFVQCTSPAQYPSSAVPFAQYPSPAVPFAQYPSSAVPFSQYPSPAVPFAQHPSPVVPFSQYPSPAVPFTQYSSPIPSAPFSSPNFSYQPGSAPATTNSSLNEKGPIKNRMRDQFKYHQRKGPNEKPMKKESYTKLIYELADARRWPKPRYVYREKSNDYGFCAILSINDHEFTGSFHPSKNQAKENASRLAYMHMVYIK